MKKIFKIAVTGSAGSGKSLVCSRFSELGLPVLDCDVLAREVVEPGMSAFQKIVDLFGPGVVRDSGGLNRERVRRIITRDARLKREMEKVVHPEILTALFSRIEDLQKRKKRGVVVEIPLLFELDLQSRFDYTVTVAACSKEMIRRIKKRDGVAGKEAEHLLKLQKSQRLKIEKSHAVVWNTGTPFELFKNVDRVYKKIEKEYLT